MEKIFAQFPFEGRFSHAERYGEGHINETYAFYVEGAAVRRYIVQRINHRLFTDIGALMSNISKVTQFCRAAVAARGGDTERECLSLIKTKSGADYYFDGEGYWRAYVFIEGATTHQIATPQLFAASGAAFGGFAMMLSNFDAAQLYDVLPQFHNTVVRYANFEAAVSADVKSRAQAAAAEIAFAAERRHICGGIVQLLDSGKMPYRVTHNDTKLNNVMIDDRTGKGIAVIDLDTVMKGSLCYDFGDSVRFGCNSSFEDQPNLDKVSFLIDNYRAYADAYLKAVGSTITPLEREMLPLGCILMTYECGIRFLTDYLNGDTYFKTKHPDHNLHRARVQFKLVSDMEKQLNQMHDIIRQA